MDNKLCPNAVTLINTVCNGITHEFRQALWRQADRLRDAAVNELIIPLLEKHGKPSNELSHHFRRQCWLLACEAAVYNREFQFPHEVRLKDILPPSGSKLRKEYFSWTHSKNKEGD